MQKSLRLFLVVLLALAAHPLRAPAQQPSSAPEPSTSRAARQRYQVVVPAGFKRVNIDGRSVLLQDADEKWVTEAIQTKTPTTQPSTMPSQLLDALTTERAALKARLAADLGLSDPGAVDMFLDDRVVPALRQLADLDPQLIYLVISPVTLREIVKSGWEDPHFYYNRVADDIAFNPSLSLSFDADAGDDNVLPAMFDPASSPEDRKSQLQALISSAERSVMNDVSMRAQRLIWLGFMQFISEQIMQPLQPKPDQQWFAMGVGSVLSARYASQLIGVPASEIISGLIEDDPRNPIRSATIDLTNPTDLSQLRQEYLGAYTDAFNRKSVRAAQTLIVRGGEGAVVKIVAAWKQNPPANGAALIELIKQTTNLDLKAEVRPQ